VTADKGLRREPADPAPHEQGRVARDDGDGHRWKPGLAFSVRAGLPWSVASSHVWVAGLASMHEAFAPGSLIKTASRGVLFPADQISPVTERRARCGPGG